MKFFLVVFTAFFLNLSAPAQHLVSSLKDKQGRLWFNVADRGVYVYDGRSFSNFSKIHYSAAINLSACLYEDRSGMLWFTGSEGLYAFDGTKFSEFHLPYPAVADESDKLSALYRIPVKVLRMMEDDKGRFWFLTADHGVYCYNKTLKDSMSSAKPAANYLAGETPNCIMQTRKGEIYLGSWQGGGLYRYQEGPTAQSGEFRQMQGFSDGMIACIVEDRKGDLWVGTRNRTVDRYDGTSVKNFSLKDGLTDNTIYCAYEDSKGRIWLGSDAIRNTIRGDAFFYDGKSFTNVTADLPLTHIEGFIYGVKSIIEDNDGRIWIGSLNGLLLCYDGKRFTDFSTQLTR